MGVKGTGEAMAPLSPTKRVKEVLLRRVLKQNRSI
jgi:hypothetical protein